MTRKRLLVISPRFLFPLDQGGRIRTANTLRHMKGGAFTITLASPAPRDAARFAAETQSICDRFLSWPEPLVTQLGKIAGLVSRLPVSVATDASAAGKAVIAAALAERPDAVLVDFPHAAVFLPGELSIPAIMFTHNVEAEILERHAGVARFPRNLIWRDQARKMRRFEASCLRRFGSVIAVSERDAEALRRDYGLSRVEAVETGVDIDYYSFHQRQDNPPADGGTIVFTGAMDSRSNIDGIRFLMDSVWPRIVSERPRARAVIAGRNPPGELVDAATSRGLNWSFTGFVPDIRLYVADADLSVIPLRVGSGTRLKVFESMAMGCAVVSTTLGVEGLDVTSGEHYLNADTAEDFAAAILRLLDDPASAARLANAARDLVTRLYAWPVVTRHFEQICLDAGMPPT